MRTLTTPRDHNPYQGLLHDALGGEGVEPEFLAMPTGSRSLNLLLVPVTLLRARLGGVRILHVHWVFGLTFAGSESSAVLRRLSQAWFAVILFWCRLIGVRVVWTAHNVLPHDRVFHDDRAARARLLRSSSHVIVHDAAVSEALADLVGGPSVLPPVTVVPHGSFIDVDAQAPATPTSAARERLALPHDRRLLLFFGRVTREKGVTDLVEAWSDLAGEHADALLVVAGRCTDPGLEAWLRDAADRLAGRLHLDLRHLPDDDLRDHLVASDVVVMPFRSVTTSGSALMAMARARAVVVPDLPPLASLPDAACLRYDRRSEHGLRDALTAACVTPADELATAGEAGRTWTAEAPGWPVAARRTAQVYRRVLEQRVPR